MRDDSGLVFAEVIRCSGVAFPSNSRERMATKQRYRNFLNLNLTPRHNGFSVYKFIFLCLLPPNQGFSYPFLLAENNLVNEVKTFSHLEIMK